MQAPSTFDADPELTRSDVRAVALKYVRDEQDAEDVTQDAMLLAFRYQHSFRGESQFSTWLYRVTATAALMFLRTQRRRAREVPSSHAHDDEGAPLLERHPSPTDVGREVAARGELAVVLAAVTALGAKYPAVFWKRHGEGVRGAPGDDRRGPLSIPRYLDTSIRVYLDAEHARAASRRPVLRSAGQDAQGACVAVGSVVRASSGHASSSNGSFG